jgi:hypothetical protein
MAGEMLHFGEGCGNCATYGGAIVGIMFLDMQQP